MSERSSHFSPRSRTDLVYLHIALENSDRVIVREQANRRGMSVNAFIAYLVHAFRDKRIIILDETVGDTVLQPLREGMMQDARRAARREARAVLVEEGFVTSPYEE